jgi:hypothetical protein
LLALATDVPVVSADRPFLGAVHVERERLWRFYRVGLAAYDRDAERAGRELRRVLSEDGANPYYRWFVGSRPS